MKKAVSFLERIEEVFLVAMLVLMMLVTFIAAFGRYSGLFGFKWSEEFVRYCMVWMVFIGVIAAARRGGHFAVEALDIILPAAVVRVFIVLRTLLVIAFNTYAAYLGCGLIQKQMGTGQITPSLRWPYWVMYLSIPIGLGLMAVRYTAHSVTLLRKKDLKETIVEEAKEP